MWWLLALGCYEPLSNAVFEEDQLYLEALPDRSFLGPAERFLSGQPEAEVASAARDAAAELEVLTLAALDVGELLREASPDRRGVSSRTWEAQGLTTAGIAWWVQAEAVREDDGLVTWSVSGAERSTDTYVLVGEGAYDPERGLGELWWDLEQNAALLGVQSVTGELEVGYSVGDNGVVHSRIEQVKPGEVSLGQELWEVWDLPGGEYDGLAFLDRFTVTGDGRALDGWAIAVENDTAGRAQGVVVDGERELSFLQCWDAEGERVHQSGDTGIETVGDAVDCAIEAFD